MTSEAPEQQAARDSKTGRFLPGASGNPDGRPSQRTLRAALKDMTDADDVAKQLIRRSKKSDQVLMFIFNQLEGMPKQSTTTEHTGSLDVNLSWADGT